VLVCPTASPSWTILFAIAGAVVTDGGGPLAHAAIVAREHGLPAVVGTVHATTKLADGQMVTVDGTDGTVTIHSAD
jgi:pyruvate,water dikinase